MAQGHRQIYGVEAPLRLLYSCGNEGQDESEQTDQNRRLAPLLIHQTIDNEKKNRCGQVVNNRHEKIVRDEQNNPAVEDEEHNSAVPDPHSHAFREIELRSNNPAAQRGDSNRN